MFFIKKSFNQKAFSDIIKSPKKLVPLKKFSPKKTLFHQKTFFTKTKWKLNKQLDFNSFNIVYMIECQKENCKKRYVGETKRSLKYRLAEHRGYVTNQHIDKATGAHFNTARHSLSNLKILILEQVRKKEIEYRKQREKYFIRKLNTLNKNFFTTNFITKKLFVKKKSFFLQKLVPSNNFFLQKQIFYSKLFSLEKKFVTNKLSLPKLKKKHSLKYFFT